eukprot:2314186-Amphidinium_carterae.2
MKVNAYSASRVHTLAFLLSRLNAAGGKSSNTHSSLDTTHQVNDHNPVCRSPDDAPSVNTQLDDAWNRQILEPTHHHPEQYSTKRCTEQTVCTRFKQTRCVPQKDTPLTRCKPGRYRTPLFSQFRTQLCASEPIKCLADNTTQNKQPKHGTHTRRRGQTCNVL